MQRTEAGTASIASMLEPVAAGLFGYLGWGRLEPIQIVGMVELAGIVIATLPAKAVDGARLLSGGAAGLTGGGNKLVRLPESRQSMFDHPELSEQS